MLLKFHKTLARNCGIFFKIRHYVNQDTLKLLYYSLFYSFLSYGTIVWGLTHPSVILPLYKLQTKVIRAICFEDRLAHTSLLFHKLETLKLSDIHSLQLVLFLIVQKSNHYSIFKMFSYQFIQFINILHVK